MKKPAIAIVGVGRLGSALAKQLHSAGYRISELVIGNKRSLRLAGRLARSCGAVAATLPTAKLDAAIVWFCVPDAQIPAIAGSLAERNWKGKVALHSSGVLTSDALVGLREAGASVASVHPLMTFVRGSSPDLNNVPFAMEGDRTAVPMVKRLVRSLGGRAVTIRKQDKPAYHLFATMVCPLLISLLAASQHAAELAGISERDARRRMLPIVRQTLANYEHFGAAAAFTGPFVRGDVATVQLHLKAVTGDPILREAYCALARAALAYLPGRNAHQLRRLLGRKKAF